MTPQQLEQHIIDNILPKEKEYAKRTQVWGVNKCINL